MSHHSVPIPILFQLPIICLCCLHRLHLYRELLGPDLIDRVLIPDRPFNRALPAHRRHYEALGTTCLGVTRLGSPKECTQGKDSVLWKPGGPRTQKSFLSPEATEVVALR